MKPSINVQVVSENWDYNICFLSCNVITQDVTSSLPNKITVLLDGEQRKNLGLTHMTSSNIRIFRPW